MQNTHSVDFIVPSLREDAHKYIDLGWNIFPCQSRSKEPHHRALAHTKTVYAYSPSEEPKPSWKALQFSPATHDLVDRWFDFDRSANLALICGKTSGRIVVIDIDTPKDSMTADVKSLYDDPATVASYVLQDLTLSATTGAGGKHLFCRMPQDLVIGCFKVPHQIDIKGEGGYIILPPSIHPNGNSYTFDNNLFALRKENMSSLAEFPSLLIPRAKQSLEKKTSEEWLHDLGGVVEGLGARNQTAASLTGKLITAIHHEFEKDDYEDGRFLPAMWDFMRWWNQKNKPPMKESELLSVFKSITKRTS